MRMDLWPRGTLAIMEGQVRGNFMEQELLGNTNLKMINSL